MDTVEHPEDSDHRPSSITIHIMATEDHDEYRKKFGKICELAQAHQWDATLIAAKRLLEDPTLAFCYAILSCWCCYAALDNEKDRQACMLHLSFSTPVLTKR
jgi:hypothetical protein